jgi:hypothetical protein
MPTLKLEFTIDTGDIDVDTARAVSEREDVQAMLVNLIEGTLVTIAQNDLAESQAPSEATRRINLLPIDLLKAAALTNDYGRLPLPPLVDAIIGEVLADISHNCPLSNRFTGCCGFYLVGVGPSLRDWLVAAGSLGSNSCMAHDCRYSASSCVYGWDGSGHPG